MRDRQQPLNQRQPSVQTIGAALVKVNRNWTPARRSITDRGRGCAARTTLNSGALAQAAPSGLLTLAADSVEITHEAR